MNKPAAFIRFIYDQFVLNRVLRNWMVKLLDILLYRKIFRNDAIQALPAERKQKYYYLSSVLYSVNKNLDKGIIDPAVTRKMVESFTQGGLKVDRRLNLNPVKEAYKAKYGEYPPTFCVLSPTKACNLRCQGCYATSDNNATTRLDYDMARRVVDEVYHVFGSRFMTISGGEPFMYKSDGKTLFDLFAEHRDMFFLVYTNGTLLNERAVERLADIGNVTPCISVEGYASHTDDRRGKGVHDRITNAMDLLRRHGVPYGVSITATSKNIDILLTEDLYDHYFDDLGITYAFQFQMMPLGRGKEIIDLMITPAQRVALFSLWEKLLRVKRYPIVDFWNSGALVDGCIAYGRWSGYFYVNWQGNVMPCVFVPFYKDNVYDLYANGKTLADALQSKLFVRGRKWQKEAGFGNPQKRKNTLMPCSIWDHFDNFKKNILTDDARGENADADAMRHDEEFARVLYRYNHELERLTQKIFSEQYLGDTPTGQDSGLENGMKSKLRARAVPQRAEELV